MSSLAKRLRLLSVRKRTEDSKGRKSTSEVRYREEETEKFQIIKSLQLLCSQQHTQTFEQKQQGKRGRPMKRKTMNRRTAVQIYRTRTRLTETDVMAIKLFHRSGVYRHADLCYMFALPRSTCTYVLKSSKAGERLQKVRHVRQVLENWEDFEQAKGMLSSVMAAHPTHRSLNSLRCAFVEMSNGRLIIPRFRLRALLYYGGYSFKAKVSNLSLSQKKWTQESLFVNQC